MRANRRTLEKAYSEPNNDLKSTSLFSLAADFHLRRSHQCPAAILLTSLIGTSDQVIDYATLISKQPSV